MGMKRNELVVKFTVDVPVLKHAEAVHHAYVLDVKLVVFQIVAARHATILQGTLKIKVANQALEATYSFELLIYSSF